jgi:hypothetical protein
MDKKIDTLYDLCEMTFKELESTKRELENAGGQLDEQHVEYLKDLTEMLKDIKCVIGMMEDEEEGYSGNYYYDDDMSMARGGRGGRSNARGGRSNARGGSYERGRSNRRGYTRMESRDDFVDRFEELMDEAPDEVTRKKLERLMMEMK